MVDHTSYFWDTVLDILFIGGDIYNLITMKAIKIGKTWLLYLLI